MRKVNIATPREVIETLTDSLIDGDKNTFELTMIKQFRKVVRMPMVLTGIDRVIVRQFVIDLLEIYEK